MAKLTITRGLPASGKSTWAEQQRKADPEGVRVVTLDDIRAALGCVYDQGDEPIAQGVKEYTIRRFLEMGYHVISADTNLPERVVRRLASIAESCVDDGVRNLEYLTIPVEIEDFRDVSLETCLARNTLRWMMGDQKVPDDAIRSMHERFILNMS